MVERIRSRRAPTGRKTTPKPGEKPRRGARPGAGRKAGGVNATTELKLKKARDQGMDAAELLNSCALTGHMLCGNRYEELTVDQRMDAAKAAAPYYRSKLQPRAVEGQQPPTYRVELDVAKLAGLPTDKLAVMREVLQMMAKGMPGMADLVPTSRADPAAYARTLRPDSKTEGRA